MTAVTPSRAVCSAEICVWRGRGISPPDFLPAMSALKRLRTSDCSTHPSLEVEGAADGSFVDVRLRIPTALAERSRVLLEAIECGGTTSLNSDVADVLLWMSGVVQNGVLDDPDAFCVASRTSIFRVRVPCFLPCVQLCSTTGVSPSVYGQKAGCRGQTQLCTVLTVHLPSRHSCLAAATRRCGGRLCRRPAS